ncbi:MAG: hypothetical protein AAFV53_04335 [Myxococcota bacterium]
MNSNTAVRLVILVAMAGAGAALIAGLMFFLTRTPDPPRGASDAPPAPTAPVVEAETVEALPMDPAAQDTGEPDPEAPAEADGPPEAVEEDDAIADAVTEADVVEEGGGEAVEEIVEPEGRCQDVPGVVRHSATKYTLQKSFLDRFVFDQQQAQQLGWAGWRTNKRGQKVGVRVRRLKCPPIAAGLQNKDVIKEVNGRPITSMTSAFAAYRDVKNRDRITVKVRRARKNVILQYTLEH